MSNAIFEMADKTRADEAFAENNIKNTGKDEVEKELATANESFKELEK